MELNFDALAAMVGQALQISANSATALHRAGLLHPNEQANIYLSLKEVAELLEAISGDALPPGLASELQARAYDMGFPEMPGTWP